MSRTFEVVVTQPRKYAYLTVTLDDVDGSDDSTIHALLNDMADYRDSMGQLKWSEADWQLDVVDWYEVREDAEAVT